jgi:hypothetical protein
MLVSVYWTTLSEKAVILIFTAVTISDFRN